MSTNLLEMTDFYKHTHSRMYPKGTTHVHSYIESRGSTLPSGKILFFGLQAFISDNLGMCSRLNPTYMEHVCAEAFNADYFDPSRWVRLNHEMDTRLPIKICAVQEGNLYEPGTALVTIENTHPDFYWLPQFLETMLLRAVWYGSTVATISMEAKLIIDSYCKKQGTSVTPFHLLDFGARGVSSHESAGIGGAAHLINFMGTDNIEGLIFARQHYKACAAGFSAMATEHSIMTAYGQEGEMDIVKKLLELRKDVANPLSIVIDSYDEDAFLVKLEKIPNLSELNIVIRPDSGDPVTELPKMLAWAHKHGCKVLWSDGISLEALPKICQAVVDANLPLDKVMFGMGGKLLQDVTRDTLKFAQKASAISINGGWRPIHKNPKKDPSKASRPGRFLGGELELVYEDDRLIRKMDFDQIKRNAEISRKCLELGK